MSSAIRTLGELRREQYNYHSKLYPYVNQWKKNPYTWIKARFYMEASALLLSLLVRTNIKPNSITIVYGMLGIVGGVLLAIPNDVTIIAAVCIFFSKGILDWSDGHLARIRGQTSLTGHILDMYGAHVNSLGFQMGLGFYVAHKGGSIYLYLIPLIPLFYALSITNYSYSALFKAIPGLLHKQDSEARGQHQGGHAIVGASRWYTCLSGILDDRARNVDLIALLILAELVYPQVFVTWIIYLLCDGRRV